MIQRGAKPVDRARWEWLRVTFEAAAAGDQSAWVELDKGLRLVLRYIAARFPPTRAGRFTDDLCQESMLRLWEQRSVLIAIPTWPTQYRQIILKCARWVMYRAYDNQARLVRLPVPKPHLGRPRKRLPFHEWEFLPMHTAREKERTGLVVMDDGSNAMDDMNEHDEVNAAVARLQDEDALLLRERMAGVTLQEIGDEHGVTREAIRLREVTIHKKLKKMLRVAA